MSQRPGILTTHRVSARGRWPETKSPNTQPDVITAEIRVHWPSPAPRPEVMAALTAAYMKALREINEHPSWDRFGHAAPPERAGS